jgi:hypothetical protein
MGNLVLGKLKAGRQLHLLIYQITYLLKLLIGWGRRVQRFRKPIVTRSKENQWHVIKVQSAAFAVAKA